jgi:hypothetical protein
MYIERRPFQSEIVLLLFSFHFPPLHVFFVSVVVVVVVVVAERDIPGLYMAIWHH